LALDTIAVVKIIQIEVLYSKVLTNGGEGMMLMNRPTFLGIQIFTKQEYFYLALVLAVLITLFVIFLMRSKLGYSFIAMREDQDVAVAMGMNSTVIKSKTIFICSFIASLKSVFYEVFNHILYIQM